MPPTTGTGPTPRSPAARFPSTPGVSPTNTATPARTTRTATTYSRRGPTKPKARRTTLEIGDFTLRQRARAAPTGATRAPHRLHAGRDSARHQPAGHDRPGAGQQCDHAQQADDEQNLD